MNASRMRNIIVLKDLPSNLVDEAIVILKNGETLKRQEIIENVNNKEFGEHSDNNSEVAIKEAEFLVSDYIKKLEKPNEQTPSIRKLRLQYKKLQVFSLFLCLTTIVGIIISIFK